MSQSCHFYFLSFYELSLSVCLHERSSSILVARMVLCDWWLLSCQCCLSSLTPVATRTKESHSFSHLYLVGAFFVLLSCFTIISPRISKRVACVDLLYLPICLFSQATFCNGVGWFGYGYFVLADPLIWAPNLLGIAAATLQLSLFARFGFSK